MRNFRWAISFATAVVACALVNPAIPEASASPDCPTGQVQTGGACAPCKKLKPCYDGAGEMLALTNQIIPLVNSFVKSQYSNMPDVANWGVIDTGSSAKTGCGTQDSKSAYAYCPADDSIYLGADQMWQFYSDYSDAAVAMGIAHEYGHHVQHEAGAPAAETIALEEQADCFAGAWSKYMTTQGVMDSNDLANVGDFIPLIASSENDPNRDHGDIPQRIQAFNAGFAGGLTACHVSGLPDLIHA